MLKTCPHSAVVPSVRLRQSEDSHPKDASRATAAWGLQPNRVISAGWIRGGALTLVTALGTVSLAAEVMRRRVLGVLSDLSVSCLLLAFCLASHCKGVATSLTFHGDVPFFLLSPRQAKKKLLEPVPACGSYLSSHCRQASSSLLKYGRFPVKCLEIGEGVGFFATVVLILLHVQLLILLH